MNRIRNFLLCLVLLGLVGILHHTWLQMSGSTGLVTPASAQTLGSQFAGQNCNGTGIWHFVHNQDGGASGTLCATFTGTGCGTVCVTSSKTTPATTHYFVGTSGSCTLQSAFDNINGGNLVLSDVSCTATPTPSPTPSPSPAPSPVGSP